MPRLLAGLLGASLLPAARALAATARRAVPDVSGYQVAEGLVLTRYAAGDTTLRSAKESAARCDELGDTCAGFTCNSDATACSLRAPTMLHSSATGEVTYEKTIDNIIKHAVMKEVGPGLKKMEEAAAVATAKYVVEAPSPPPALLIDRGSSSSGGFFGGIQADEDPYAEASAGVIAGMKQARQGELAKTQQAVQAAKDGQAAQIASMKAAIAQARQNSLPQVVLTAEQWTRAAVQQKTVELESSYLQQSVIYEEEAEKLRQSTTASTEDLLRVAKAMAELAREAEDVAKHLSGTHAAQFAADRAEEDSQWKDIATQSRRFSELASKMTRDSAILANKALAQAKASEVDAAKALETANENTQRLASIKKRAQAVLNLVKRR